MRAAGRGREFLDETPPAAHFFRRVPGGEARGARHRLCLGDAQQIPRPHTAGGVRKQRAMPEATLDQFVALNDQLAALQTAGLPMDLGWSDEGDLSERLAQINAVVARRVERGATLAEALEDNADRLPAKYRCIVEAGLRSGQVDAAIDGVQRIAAARAQSRRLWRLALAYPLLVGAMAYAGLLAFGLWLAPVIEATLRDADVPAGRTIRWLAAMRSGWAWWAAAPLVLIPLWLGWRWIRGNATAAGARVPGSVEREQWASFAATAATLIESGAPVDEALQLTACAVGRPGDYPPFLRWAIDQSEPAVGRARALRMAADVYHEAAADAAQRDAVVRPLVACAAIGGTAVLLYGLALFLPVTDLLYGLAETPAIGK